MLTNNTAPMLGSARNGGNRRFWPQSARNAGKAATKQRRSIRSDEQADLAYELTLLDDSAEFVSIDDIDDTILRGVPANDEYDWTAERALDDLLDDEPVCYCRRCFLHDDPANCLYLDERHALRLGTLDPTIAPDADGIWTLDDADLPGWGSARVDYTDFVSGFRITDRP